MKLSTLLLIMIALQFSLMLYGGTSYTSYAGNSTETGTNSTALWTFATHPYDWRLLGLISWQEYLAAGVIGMVVIVGSLVIGKTDLMVFAPAVAVFIGFCIPIAGLWTAINSEIGYFGDASWLIASVICAPLGILSFVTVFNWWRSASDIS
jgi:hypothetical protein